MPAYLGVESQLEVSTEWDGVEYGSLLRRWGEVGMSRLAGSGGEGRSCDPRLETLGLAAVLKPRGGRPPAPWW